ncbi:unannotated protein [freshwater metagenome]|uniref:protein-L-isoaspartate(D-aspartate) O-methyltransferase n=1 Tax=freshwater metagenome TaxID=449393 RepID=A0A6J7KB62_9ZZZZ
MLRAIGDVPRRLFAPDGGDSLVDIDTPVPIPFGQTTSQPSTIALMVEALDLRPSSRVLEIGTGYGYEAAVLSRLAAEVWSVEWWPALAEVAAANLAGFGADHVHVVTGDGRLGLPEQAPYDAIVVAAQSADIPPALIAQLAVGGRLVMPLGPAGSEECVVLTTDANGGTYWLRTLGAVHFVPLLGG